jgi:hypothetical protein
MGYAPHTNNDVKQQLRALRAAGSTAPTELPMILGEITEAEFGHSFEYAERRWFDDEVQPDFPHIIYVGDGQARLAKVLKTVAWVLTGEGEVQKWSLKKNRQFDTDWVRS